MLVKLWRIKDLILMNCLCKVFSIAIHIYTITSLQILDTHDNYLKKSHTWEIGNVWLIDGVKPYAYSASKLISWIKPICFSFLCPFFLHNSLDCHLNKMNRCIFLNLPNERERGDPLQSFRCCVVRLSWLVEGVW